MRFFTRWLRIWIYVGKIVIFAIIYYEIIINDVWFNVIANKIISAEIFRVTSYANLEKIKETRRQKRQLIQVIGIWHQISEQLLCSILNFSAYFTYFVMSLLVSKAMNRKWTFNAYNRCQRHFDCHFLRLIANFSQWQN